MLDLMRSNGWTAEYFLRVVSRAKKNDESRSSGDNVLVDLSELDSLISLNSAQERERVNSLEDALSLASNDDDNADTSDDETGYEDEIGLLPSMLARLYSGEVLDAPFVIDGEIKFCIGVADQSKECAIDHLWNERRWHPKKTASILDLDTFPLQQNEIIRKVNRSLSVHLRWTSVVDEIATPSPPVVDIRSVSTMINPSYLGKSTFQNKLLINALIPIMKNPKKSYSMAALKSSAQSVKQLSTAIRRNSGTLQQDPPTKTSALLPAAAILPTPNPENVAGRQVCSDSPQNGAVTVVQVRAATLTSSHSPIKSAITANAPGGEKIPDNAQAASAAMLQKSNIKSQEEEDVVSTAAIRSEKSKCSEEKAGKGIASSSSPIKPQRSILATRIQFQS